MPINARGCESLRTHSENRDRPLIKTARLACQGIALIALAACSPESKQETPSDDAVPRLAGELLLPPGFRAQVVFDGTGESRELYIREDGDLFVSLAGIRDGNQVLGLRDEDGDHVVDTVQGFHSVRTPDDQSTPQVHIEYDDGYLFAVDNENIVRLPLPRGSLTPTGPGETIVRGIPYQSSHRGRTLSMDADGWIYVNIGAPSNACQTVSKTTGSPGMDPCPELEGHAGIWRWRSDVTNQTREDGERYATGIRNAIAQTWDEHYGGLYVAQMGRDRLDSLWPDSFTTPQNAELPAEEFFRVEKGQNFGWPYCYYDPEKQLKVLAPEYGGDGTIVGRCSDFEDPTVAFPAHYSPSSIAFYHADQFPEHYRGGAFVALKGSWNRAPLPQDGFIVAFVPFTEGQPTGDWETFADGFTGFETLYERGNAVYRPQSVAVHPDGSLYILDNNTGRIWRVMWTGDMSPIDVPIRDNDRELIVATSQGEGAELYLQYCGSCHQPSGGGVPGQFPPLAGADWVVGDKGRLIRIVMHGMQGIIERNGEEYSELMPGHAFLDEEQMAQLLTYIRSAFGNAAEPVHEAEVVLVKNTSKQTEPWAADALTTMTGLALTPDNSGTKQ
jgi:glucose/arabinose dehydrogenase/mono/diheme cytochrome c family protein